MKKTLLALSTLMILLVLAACGSVDDNGEDAVTCEWSDGNVFRVGMDMRYPPFEMRDDNDEPDGISVDIAKAFAEYLECEVEIVDINFGNLIDSLTLGDIDAIIASMSRTEARAELINFSDPYMYFKIIGLMNRDYADANNLDEDSTVEDILAIETTTFVGISGQVSYSLPFELGIPEERVTSAPDQTAAVASVANGDFDIMMMSAAPVSRGHQANLDDTVVMWDPFDSSPIAIGLRQGEDDLLDMANAFVASMDEAGGLNEQLSERWDDAIFEILDRYGLEFFLNE